MPLTYHVLLTGGVGSRLWPLSRQSRPKQYLQLFSDSSPELAAVTSSVLPDGEANGENVSRSGGENVTEHHSLFELAVKRNAAFADSLIVVPVAQVTEIR
ncbi:hypothetical protein LZ575_12780 [Antarcticibacterium sp. 1MA-6-2]|nr:hypothetical protein LZ575_12780 [Antarcticibacterium sp. 1MA-6-2]